MLPIYRTHTLIAKKFQQIGAPNAFSSLVKKLIVCADSFIAGQFLSMSALEAMALVVPFLAIDEMLHRIIGQGITVQISQAAGRGDRQSINRIVGAVLYAVIVVYTIVLIPTIFLSGKILHLISESSTLVRGAVQYIVPTMIFMPIFEVCLCLERAYQIDGRAKLFVIRPIVSGCMNIILDVLFVAVLHKGIISIAVATIISTALGYCITLSHGFSKKCTVKPDFSVIKDYRECWRYLKFNIIIGGSAAIDEGTKGFINGFICGLLSSSGGSGALAIWLIYSQIIDIVYGFTIGLGNGMKLLGGVLFGEEDYVGTKMVEIENLKSSTYFGLIITILTFFFTPYIAKLYGLEASYIASCTTIIKIVCPAFLFYALLNNLKIYFSLINRFKLSYVILILEKIFLILFTYIGAKFSTVGIFIGNSACYLTLLLLIAFIMIKDRAWLLPKTKDYGFSDYSIILNDEQIVKVSKDVQQLAVKNGYRPQIAMQFSMLMEDGLGIIREKNAGSCVSADIRVSDKEDKLIISIMDNGMPYNLITSFDSDVSPVNIEQLVVNKISDDCTYYRILELNHLVLKLSSRR